MEKGFRFNKSLNHLNNYFIFSYCSLNKKLIILFSLLQM